MSEAGLGQMVTRVVSFAWKGHRMSLALSQSLFSSAGVDLGTQLLLKSLAALRPELPAHPRTLDLGCGVGVLGIALALDGAEVVFRDRDALALAFSADNCRANGVVPAAIEGELDFAGLGAARFDLIVSNLPAKAGECVHRAMVGGIRRHLEPGGVALFVVVAPILDRIRRAASEAGIQATLLDHTPAHAVLRLTPTVDGDPAAPPPDPLAPYRRCDGVYRRSGTEYRIGAMHDLPEFDTPSHATVLALEALARLGPPRGEYLVWNPGQGHVPAWLSRRGGAGGTIAITAAGRDLLALRATEANAPAVRRTVHTWSPAQAGSGYRVIVFFPDDDPAARWEENLSAHLAASLQPSGTAVLAASSTFVGRFLRAADGFRVAWSRKNAGCRCVVLERAGRRPTV